MFKWHERFVQGRDCLEDDVLTGEPTTVWTVPRVEEASMLVHAKLSQSVDDLTAAVGISHGMCVQIHLTRISFAIYAIQFVLSFLNFGATGIGCCYMIAPLHIGLCLSKRNWQGNSSSFCHTLHTHLISHHAISLFFLAWKESYISVVFSWLRRSSLP